MNALLNKIAGVFGGTSFEGELKNEMKNFGLSIAKTADENILKISDSTVDFDIDISAIKSSNDKDEIAEFILGVKKDAEMYKRLVSFTNAQSYLRFLAIDEKDVTGKMIFTDFGGGLKKVMVFTNDNERFFFLEEKYLLKWAVPREVLFSVADRNMARFLDSSEIKHFEITSGVNALEIACDARMLSSSLMMCGGFRSKIHESLGPKFLVLAPSRESIIVLDNITNNLLERLSTIIVKEYRHSKFPLTTNVFLFTPDSVKVAGHFKTSSW